MPPGCQIEDCGVVAIGRCHRCNRAFYMSHQAIGRTLEGVLQLPDHRGSTSQTAGSMLGACKLCQLLQRPRAERQGCLRRQRRLGVAQWPLQLPGRPWTCLGGPLSSRGQRLGLLDHGEKTCIRELARSRNMGGHRPTAGLCLAFEHAEVVRLVKK